MNRVSMFAATQFCTTFAATRVVCLKRVFRVVTFIDSCVCSLGPTVRDNFFTLFPLLSLRSETILKHPLYYPTGGPRSVHYNHNPPTPFGVYITKNDFPFLSLFHTCLRNVSHSTFIVKRAQLSATWLTVKNQTSFPTFLFFSRRPTR